MKTLLLDQTKGLKRRKTSKDDAPSKGSKSKESKSSSSKGTKSQPKSSGKSVQAEESVFETTDTKMPESKELLIFLKGHAKAKWNSKYHFEECYKVVTDRLDWNNPEGQEISFDLGKLMLIEDRSKYTNSTTKTKVAKYDDIQGIEDMIPSLWSLVKVAYDSNLCKSYEVTDRALRMLTDVLVILKRGGKTFNQESKSPEEAEYH
ncbi:hypothetical protein Tco_0013784 [Tanacetum coccineum]